MRARLQTIWPFMAALAWMAGILLLSHQSGLASNDLSMPVASGVETLIEPVGNGLLSINNINFITRKIGHLMEYSVLAVLLANAVTRLWRRMVWGASAASVIAVGFAMFDEWVQMSSPGRNSTWVDVVVDAAGVLLGIALFVTVSARWSGSSSAKETAPGG